MARTHISSLLQHFSLPPAESDAAAEGLESYSPADGSLLARVHTSGAAGYNTVMSQAVAAARAWSEIPAPQRGIWCATSVMRCASTSASWPNWYRSRMARSSPRGWARCRR